MTAHEEQDERVVLMGFVLNDGRRRLGFGLHCGCGFPAAGQIAAQVVGHPAVGDVNQPGARSVGNTFAGPLQRGGEQCFLNGALGRCEVAKTADDCAEHLRRQVAQQMLGGCVERTRGHRNSSGGPLITWRTSIGMFAGDPPGPGAADARAAIA